MRTKIHIWLPLALLIYVAIMAFQFKDDLLGAGRHYQFYATIGVELIVIALLYFFLRKRAKLRGEREDEERRLRNRNRENDTFDDDNKNFA